MSKESFAVKRARAIEVCHRMQALYGDVRSALQYTDPYTLLICVMLSAQSTDASVNKVTPEFFRRWPDPASLAPADPAEVGTVIRSIGFWRTKAEHCVETAQILVSDYNEQVPHTMEELTSLPGVGRKTANIVLNRAFHITEGIAVDTHVFRIATRLGFTKASTPLAAEQDLLKLIPQELWSPVNEQWIHFGRETCSSQHPHCDGCPLADLCPSFGNPDRFRKHGKHASKKTASRSRKRNAANQH